MAIAGVAAGVWWFYGEEIKRWDGRVMKLEERDAASKGPSGREGSFFDTD